MPALAQRKKRPSDTESPGLKLREAEFFFTEGEKFFILEDFSKALLYYQRALEINPSNATIHYKIAEVLARSNKQDDLIKASTCIENALKLEKGNKYFYLLAAVIYNNLARFDKSAEAYETMIREVPGTEEYLYDLAAVYQYAGQPDDAIRTYNRTEEIFGINEMASLQKLRILMESGKTREALAEGEKLMSAFPDEERYAMAFAETISQRGMRDEAIARLEKFVTANPEAGNAKMLLAGLYRDARLEEKARPLLLSLFDDPFIELNSKLIILGAYNTELNQNRQKNIQDPDKEAFALRLYEKLVATETESPELHIIGGDLYLSIGRDRDAQREYMKAVEGGEVNFEVWENLIYLEVKLEQWDDVIRHAEEALDMYPNQSMIHYFLGFSYLRKREWREAIGSLEQAKKLGHSNPAFVCEINGLLGDAYNAVREFAKSDRAYEEALAYNPEYAIVLNNYSFYLALRKENLEKAEKMAALLVKNNPNNPAFLDTYAWVLYTRQKYKEARRVIEKAISTGKANATHLEHYGDILFQLGDVDGAVEQWKKARGLNAKNENLNRKIANRKIYE